MKKNDFAKTPPMGWNSYDYYDTTVNEAQVRANAKVLAEQLKDYGWEYVVVDIQWYAKKAGSDREHFQYIPFSELAMDDYSRLIPDPDRFPSSAGEKGFGPLADYVHRLGLKFGIHIMRGVPRIAAHTHMALLGTDKTADQIANPSSICGWNPDMYGVLPTPEGQAYYDSLIALYASWGVDYIKCDDICNVNVSKNPFSGKEEIAMLHHAIEKCGRPIVLSLSPGPALIEQAWFYADNANLWRITDDFWDDWQLLRGMFDRCELWQDHVRQGCYPDCDMLPIGWLGKGFGRERYTNFTMDEARTMMTLWCLFGSPLMIGAELTRLDDATLSLLTNEELLALLDPTRTRRQVQKSDAEAVWFSTDGSDAYAALFNLSDEERTVRVAAQELPGEPVFSNAFELWSGKTIAADNEVAAMLPAHGCAVFRLGQAPC